MVQLKEIAKKINGKMEQELVVPERVFFKQLDVVALEGKKKRHQRTLFCFSDLLVLTAREKDQEKHPGEYKYLAMHRAAPVCPAPPPDAALPGQRSPS